MSQNPLASGLGPVPGPGPAASPAAELASDLAVAVAQLRAERERWRTSQRRSDEARGRELPSREAVAQVVQKLRSALFPMRLGPADLRPETEDYYVGHTLDSALATLLQQVRLELRHSARQPPRGGGAPAALAMATGIATGDAAAEQALERRAQDLVRAFTASLAPIRRLLDTDVQAAYDGDPAAHNVDEVLLCYPGIEAMIHHRLASRLYALGVPVLARVVAELAHERTGIDIHPGARIGAGCFIDHGTGVVIGETAVIGERVRLYQAVTLGAKRFSTDADGRLRNEPRHPIVEDDVVIYGGATILGRITIGRGAVIGGNVWITRDVPPGSQVTQATSRHARAGQPGAAAADL